MKKIYNSPKAEVVNVEVQSILAGSLGDNKISNGRPSSETGNENDNQFSKKGNWFDEQ